MAIDHVALCRRETVRTERQIFRHGQHADIVKLRSEPDFQRFERSNVHLLRQRLGERPYIATMHTALVDAQARRGGQPTKCVPLSGLIHHPDQLRPVGHPCQPPRGPCPVQRLRELHIHAHLANGVVEDVVRKFALVAPDVIEYTGLRLGPRHKGQRVAQHRGQFSRIGQSGRESRQSDIGFAKRDFECAAHRGIGDVCATAGDFGCQLTDLRQMMLRHWAVPLRQIQAHHVPVKQQQSVVVLRGDPCQRLHQRAFSGNKPVGIFTLMKMSQRQIA